MLAQQLVNGLTLGSMYALLAIGYTLTFGVLRLLNLAHGEVVMVAGVALFTTLTLLAWPFLAAAAAALLVALALGLVTYLLCVRPLRREQVLASLIATIGLGIVLRDSLVNLVGAEPLTTTSLPQMGMVTLDGLGANRLDLLILLSAVALALGSDLMVRRSGLGRRIRAVARDPALASLWGINVSAVGLQVLLLSAGLAGLAGVLVALRLERVSPFLGATFGLKALAVMALGGLGSVRGALLAGLAVGLAEVLAAGYLGALYADVAAWGLLVAALALRGRGAR